MSEKLHPAAFWVPVGVLAVLALLTFVPMAVFVISVYLKSGAPPAMVGDKRMHFGVPSAEWTTILETRFPVGTPHATLITVLTNEGFEIKPSPTFQGRFVAAYNWGGGFPCQYFLTATWFVDDNGKIEGISGSYTNACL